MPNIIKDLIASFFSKNFYYYIAAAGKGIGLRLIMILTLIMLIVLGIRLYEPINLFVDNAPEFIDKMPAMEFKEGKLKIDKQIPYSFKVDQDLSVLFDTSYKISDLEETKQFMLKNNIFMLINETQAIGLKETGQIEIKDFSDSKPFAISRNDWGNFAKNIVESGKLRIFSFIMLIGFFSLLIFNLSATLISSLAVAIFANLNKIELKFSDRMRIAAAFRIPVYLITFVAAELISNYSFIKIFSWLVWAAYLSFATLACKEQKI